MKRLITFLLLFAAFKVAGQTTGYLRFDTVKIMKQNGTCELYIINKTKDSLGLLTNVGGGLTRFIKSRSSGDSLFVGLDTIVMSGTDKLDSLHIYTAADPDPDTLYSYKNGDSALVGLLQKGGTDNANIGSGFRILVPATQELKTLHSDITGTWDSTSNADGLTYKVDTLTMSTRAWRQKGDDSVAAVLRQVVIDTANSLLASMSDSVVFAVSNMLIPARIEFVHAGSDTTMYQNDTLIGKQLVDVSIEGYKLGFTARASSVYMEFDSVTGTITLTNGAFVADDLILIIYRTPPIFLLDGSGNPVRDGSGNFIILN